MLLINSDQFLDVLTNMPVFSFAGVQAAFEMAQNYRVYGLYPII
jgi:hypothetical protein